MGFGIGQFRDDLLDEGDTKPPAGLHDLFFPFG
jgi:hypothetical protein